MHFSEDDLRQALKRKDPGAGFTQRVMARVNQARAEGKTEPAAKAKKTNGAFMSWWRLRPAWIVALTAVLLLGFGWAGYQYAEYHHREEVKIAQEQKRQLQEAERARDEAIRALEIARSKLNHVLQHAQLPVESNDRLRRQRL